jgi:VWFA-related protein
MKPLAILFAALAFPLLAQEARFGEKVDVNVVLLDATVTDSRGNQILGLDKNDFVVRENGVEQDVDSLEYFTNRQLLNEREEKAPFKVEQVHEERYFVFFFDKPADNAMSDRVMRARMAARDFIRERMKPADRIAVVGHDVRLKVYSDFTSNAKQLEKALDEVSRFGRGLGSAPPDSSPSILRNLGTSFSKQTGTVYQALEAVGDALRPIRGRKNLVLFSAGIVEPGETVRDGVLLGESRYYAPMIAALNSANVAVYAISLWDEQPVPAVHQTLSRIATETNGDFFPFAVSFSGPLNRIDRSNSGYYLLGYRPDAAKNRRGWQSVSVSIRNHPEMQVKARAGYSLGE